MSLSEVVANEKNLVKVTLGKKRFVLFCLRFEGVQSIMLEKACQS